MNEIFDEIPVKERLTQIEIQLTALKQKLNSPCDLCLYNPPSSFGGKPCSCCPATPIV